MGIASRQQKKNSIQPGARQDVPSLIRSSTTATNRLDSLTIKNSVTGKVLTFPLDGGSRRGYQFKRQCRALEEVAKAQGLSVYFLTFTLSSESSDSLTKELSRTRDVLQHRFKRATTPFYYVWVVELQKKRYARTGVKALHWHLAVAVPSGTLPDVQYVKLARQHYQVRSEGSLVTSTELFKRWGKGQVLSTLAWSGVYSYLGKYMAKEFESYKEYDGLRRFGGSQLGVSAYPEWARQEINELERRGADLTCLRRVRSAGSVSFFERGVTAGIEYRRRGHKTVPIEPDADGLTWFWRLVFTLRSPWRTMRVNDDLP